MMNPLDYLGKFVTKGKTKQLQKNLIYAGIKTEPFVFSGFHFFVIASFSLVIGWGVYNFYGAFYALLAAAAFAASYYATLLSYISLLSDQRAKQVEKILPDVLLLISSNLRSGLTPEESFVLSARQEFGFFAEKIKLAGKKLAIGSNIHDALLSMKHDIDSKLFEQTLKLILEGLDSGGEMAILLESTANDIRETEALRKEVRSMIFVYALFIFIAACIIAPVLYAVSIQLASVLSRLSTSMGADVIQQAAPALTLSGIDISPKFLETFAYVNLTISTIFASLIIALINKGNEKYGLRYIPFCVGIALIIFYIGRLLLASFFGGIRVV